MAKYTYEQYVGMADRFNKLSFSMKIKTIMDNTDILTLAADGNWWGVKVKDKAIQERLYDDEKQFNIENEWQHRQMYDLIALLGIGITDI